MVPGLRETSQRLSASPVLRSWVISRVTVLAALLAAHLTQRTQHASLLAWDAAWYRDVAVHGYAGAPAGAVRYFPVWPVLGRWVAAAIGAPAGFVLVMGYSEALFGAVLCLVLLTARRGRWWPCAAAGLVAGALRPTGVLLCLAVLIEAGAGLRRQPPAGLAARVAAGCAPALGLALYLAWTWRVYGDPLAPFHAQLGPALRGGVVVDPVQTLATAVELLRQGRLGVSVPIHLVWIVIALVLLVGSARRLPASFTVFSGATLFLAVTARDFSSFERYACSALPLLLVAAVALAERPRLARVAAVAAPILLFAHALLAFTGWYTP